MDVPQRCTAETDGCRHICETALHENDVCGVNGNIRSGADGDADICTGQCRGIVDAVSHHGDLALCGKFADDSLFSVREDAGNHVIYASLLADRPGGLFVVAGEHDHLDAHVL